MNFVFDSLVKSFFLRILFSKNLHRSIYFGCHKILDPYLVRNPIIFVHNHRSIISAPNDSNGMPVFIFTAVQRRYFGSLPRSLAPYWIVFEVWIIFWYSLLFLTNWIRSSEIFKIRGHRKSSRYSSPLILRFRPYRPWNNLNLCWLFWALWLLPLTVLSLTHSTSFWFEQGSVLRWNFHLD